MAGKSNGAHNMETDWARAPPAPGTAWERISKAIYNPEDNSCLGRTPKRWAIVVTFYAIFYAVLAAMFAGCMAGLFYTLDENKPAFTLTSSLIGDNPGVSYRPFPIFGFELRYHTSNISESHPIQQQLDEFFLLYKNEPWFPTNKSCSSDDYYGFPLAPCFFIKINKIYDWVPDFYEVSALPADMPEDLKSYIGKLPANEQKQVWISCWEENGNSTTLEYPWGRGMPESFFPYVNTEGYRAPVVPVKIHAEVKKLITVRCRAWAKNIVYNKSIKEPRGYARIQFYADQEDAGADS